MQLIGNIPCQSLQQCSRDYLKKSSCASSDELIKPKKLFFEMTLKHGSLSFMEYAIASGAYRPFNAILILNPLKRSRGSDPFVVI